MEKLFKPTSQSDVSFVGAQPQAVPIFQYHAPAAGGGWKYYYSASPNITSGWTLDGICFWAYPSSFAPPGSVPVYEYQATDSSGQRFYYTTSEGDVSPGWNLDGVVFFVFKDPGATDAIPVYQYHAANADGSGERYCYSA